MESVHEKLDNRDLRYFKFVFGRAQNVEDEKIVKELGDANIDSPQILYRRLSADGYPVCLECGATPVTTPTCEACSERRRHRARSSGNKVELPAAARAKDLLREPAEGLVTAVDQLDDRVEYLQAGRFVASYVSETEEWTSNPPVLTIGPGKRYTLLGARRSPPEPLTTLIAAYALLGYPLKPLVAALHPDPASVDLEDLEDRVNSSDDGLRTVAGLVARQVRGGRVGKQGRGPRDVPPSDHGLSWWIREWSAEGVPDEIIKKKLERVGIKSSLAEIARVRNLRLGDTRDE
jgi:hypothetical protein